MKRVRTDTRANAEAVARMWAEGQIAPRDVDPRVREWETEEAVREAIKHGDLHQKQFVEEINRRRDISTMQYQGDAPRFVDHFPLILPANAQPSPTYLNEEAIPETAEGLDEEGLPLINLEDLE